MKAVIATGITLIPVWWGIGYEINLYFMRKYLDRLYDGTGIQHLKPQPEKWLAFAAGILGPMSVIFWTDLIL